MATRSTAGSDRGRDLHDLPRIVNLAARLATYEVPRVFFEGPERKEIRQAVEITIQTDRPIPGRALSPLIWVGQAAIVEMETVGRNLYRYYALNPAQLQEGAVVAFGWPETGRAARGGAQRTVTTFHYRLEPPLVA